MPLTLRKHRHTIVREKLDKYSLRLVLDVGGKSYKRDSKGDLIRDFETAELLGLNLVAESTGGGSVYFSVNVANDYDKSRYPDVVYDGKLLPFRSKSVSAVTVIDVFEHVSREYKANFISEVCRVAAKRALFVFPFDSDSNRDFEDRFAARLDEYGIASRASFKEHRQLGLARIEDARRILEELGYSYEISYHSPLEILMPYHDRQIELLITYGQGVIDKETTQRLLFELQTKTENILDHYSKELSSNTAYRVLFNVDTNISI